jgi:two-component system, NarL family, sensor histidine kinase UhpB
MLSPTKLGSPRVLRDLVWVVLGTACFAALSVHIELFETVVNWTRARERFQLDELPGTLLFLALAMVWFAWRRMGELRAELQERRAVERKLASALDANQRLARDNVRAQDEERRNLARELHDEFGQYLNAIKVDAVFIRDASAGDSREVAECALSIIESADHVQASTHAVMRRLRPSGLDDLGLVAALESCIDGWRRRLPSVQFDFAAPGAIADWGEAINMTLFRVVQEGLTNVAKHARASRVEVQLDAPGPGDGAGSIVLHVSDNGVGTKSVGGDGGFGLFGMRERLEALGGRLDSSGSASGFRLVATVPIAAVSP